MKKARVALVFVAGNVVGLGLVFLAVWHWDYYEAVYSVVPGYADLFAWECDSKRGVSTRAEMVAALGAPTEDLDEARRAVWRSMYRDRITVYRHWLYRTKPIGGAESFFTETITATFDEKGVLSALTWRHAEPVSHTDALAQKW